MTPHRRVIQQFLTQNPSWQTQRFLLKANEAIVVIDEFEEPIPPYIGFIPDAFQIDHIRKTARILEVEHSSQITKDKMDKIVELWFEFDSRSWFLELHVISTILQKRLVITDSDLTRMWLKSDPIWSHP